MAETYPVIPILIVDDEEEILRSVAMVLAMAGINNVVTCRDSREVEPILLRQSFSAVTLDLSMPHVSGRELLVHLMRNYPDIPVIVVTASNQLETAVDCMKSGAFDYLLKPVDKTRLVTSVRHAVESWEIRNENSRLREYLLSDRIENPDAFSAIMTQSGAMRSIFKYVEAVAGTALPVLITGETGVGKELLARAIHSVSARKGEFVPVNLAGLDDTLFSDTLFGHVKGAFTGAAADREGVIRRASGGTLFLDEIGDLSVESQIKLLRLLQEREYYPLGTDRARSTDARFVFATNQDLKTASESGQFRKDLFYRLRSHHIHIPPLHERKEDIPLLAEHFLEKAAREIGKGKPKTPKELHSLLRSYSFPGNIRELEGMIFDAVVRHDSGSLSLSHFREVIPENTADVRARRELSLEDGELFTRMDILPTVEQFVQMLIDEAIRRSGGNQTAAAAMLGMDRTTLNKRLKRH